MFASQPLVLFEEKYRQLCKTVINLIDYEDYDDEDDDSDDATTIVEMTQCG